MSRCSSGHWTTSGSRSCPQLRTRMWLELRPRTARTSRPACCLRSPRLADQRGLPDSGPAFDRQSRPRPDRPRSTTRRWSVQRRARGEKVARRSTRLQADRRPWPEHPTVMLPQLTRAWSRDAPAGARQNPRETLGLSTRRSPPRQHQDPGHETGSPTPGLHRRHRPSSRPAGDSRRQLSTASARHSRRRGRARPTEQEGRHRDSFSVPPT